MTRTTIRIRPAVWLALQTDPTPAPTPEAQAEAQARIEKRARERLLRRSGVTARPARGRRPR